MRQVAIAMKIMANLTLLHLVCFGCRTGVAPENYDKDANLSEILIMYGTGLLSVTLGQSSLGATLGWLFPLSPTPSDPLLLPDKLGLHLLRYSVTR
jgi:hypothetical protein